MLASKLCRVVVVDAAYKARKFIGVGEGFSECLRRPYLPTMLWRISIPINSLQITYLFDLADLISSLTLLFGPNYHLIEAGCWYLSERYRA